MFEELGQTGRVRKCCWKVAINTASLGHLLKKQKDRKGAIKSFLEVSLSCGGHATRRTRL